MKLFAEGRVAMILDTCYSLNMYRDMALGACALPQQHKEVTGLIADGIGISAKAANIAAAWKVIQFLGSRKVQQQIKAHGVGIPANPEIAASGSNLPTNINQDDYAAILQTIAHGRRLIDVSEPRVLEPLWDCMDLVWANMEGAASACSQAASSVNRLLAGYESPRQEKMR